MGDFSSLVVAGTQSGVGKTSVSISLASALTKRGLVVQTFKCGPDFLDPTWLKSASGRNCYNLDGWMMGKEYVKNLYAKNSAGADVAVTEGVMGMFDSAGPGTIEGSTAEIALILNAPVLLVVDARGMAGSICAVVKGYADFKPGIKIAGVLANNVGSERHGKILADCLKAEGLPPMLGAVPKGAFVPLGSRHLGLVSATEKSGQIEAVNALAETAEKYFDLDGILKATRVNRAPVPALAACNTQRRGKIGIASDEAFNFYYRDNLEALENAGCEIVEFSPLGDAQIPEDVAALYFGGGYPEEHAERLGQNHAMIQSVRGFVAGNRPVYAECGGLIYLSQGIESAQGKRTSLAGLLPFWTRMRKNFKSLGYVEAVLREPSLLGPAGTAVRGHRFHYSEIIEGFDVDGWRPAYSIRRPNKEEKGDDGFLRGNVLACYTHAHLASRPGLIENFAAHCQEG